MVRLYTAGWHRRGPDAALVGTGPAGRSDGRESPCRRRRCERPAAAAAHPQAGGVRRRRGHRRGGSPADLAAGDPDADPARRHAPGHRRVHGRRPHPGRRRAGHPRADHHAHGRPRRAAEGPRPAGGRRRLPDQAVPPGRADGPDEEPDRTVLAQRDPGRPAADGPGPCVLRGQGRRGHDDDRHQRRHRAPQPRAARVPGGRQPPVRRPPRVPRSGPRPAEHRGHRERPGDGRRPGQADRPDPRLGHRPAPRPALAGVGRPGHAGAHEPDPRALGRDVRLRDRRHRQAAGRHEPDDPRPGRDGVRGHDRRPVVPQERAPRARDHRPPGLPGEQGPARAQPVQRVHRDQHQERRGRAAPADRAPDRERVPGRDLGAQHGGAIHDWQVGLRARAVGPGLRAGGGPRERRDQAPARCPPPGGSVVVAGGSGDPG